MDLVDFEKTLQQLEGETPCEWFTRLEAVHAQATERSHLAHTNSIRLSATLEEHLAAAREISDADAQILAIDTAIGWLLLRQSEEARVTASA